MDESSFGRVAQLVKHELDSFARKRAADVRRGFQSPQLSARMVQIYGYGIVQTLWAIADVLDEPTPDGAPTIREVDTLAAKIDPLIFENQNIY